MLHAVIMAGGAGTRFWPLSREAHPKQCLALGTPNPLIVETSQRLRTLIPESRHRIVSGKNLAKNMLELFPNWSSKHFIWEPCARNTAPCIGLAALCILDEDPEAILVVLPSDHHVSDEPAFIAALQTATERAEAGELVTLGIKPNRAETGYGYIELEDVTCFGEAFTNVKRFVEKPNEQTAGAYLKGGKHLWNSGMFIFRASRMLDDLETYQPQLHSGLMALKPFVGTETFDEKLEAVFPRLPSISIDYGVLEPCSNDTNGRPITVVPSDFGWNDVGSWEALQDYGAVDEDGNVLDGRVLRVNTQNSIIQANGPAVAVIGMDAVVVVSTKDAVLVCPRKDVQRVKEIPTLARELNWEDLC